jgi:hypothetical protein
MLTQKHQSDNEGEKEVRYDASVFPSEMDVCPLTDKKKNWWEKRIQGERSTQREKDPQIYKSYEKQRGKCWKIKFIVLLSNAFDSPVSN